jgi:hypothetical protein
VTLLFTKCAREVALPSDKSNAPRRGRRTGAMIRTLVAAAYTKALRNPDVTPDSGVMHERVAAPCDAHWRSDGLRRSTGRAVFCAEIRTPAQARRKTATAAQAALSKRGVAVLILPVDASHLLRSTYHSSAKIGTAWAAPPLIGVNSAERELATMADLTQSTHKRPAAAGTRSTVVKPRGRWQCSFALRQTSSVRLHEEIGAPR